MIDENNYCTTYTYNNFPPVFGKCDFILIRAYN